MTFMTIMHILVNESIILISFIFMFIVYLESHAREVSRDLTSFRYTTSFNDHIGGGITYHVC